MSQYLRLFLASICFLAVAYKIQAADNHQHHHKHLECWHCSSDTVGAEDFCGVTFNEDSIPVEPLKERNINVTRNCNSTINSDQERAVCRKTIEEVDGKEITKRYCYYTNKSDSLQHCNEGNKGNRVFCEDCLTDKCNSATQVAAIMCTILLPIIVAKMVLI